MAFGSVRAGVAILLLAAAINWPRPAAAEIVAAFRPVYSVNTSGSVILRGNANLTCDGINPGCAAARADTATGGALNNDGYRMRNVDVDAEPLFNSSTADLAVPAAATVLFAGLFWGGDTAPGTGTPAPDESGRSTVRFKVPGGAYRTITASRLTDVTTFPGHRPYQGYADVSALVAGAGAWTYTVADIQAATGVNDRYAAWSLVVVLHDPAQPVRNLVVYDGFGSVRGVTPADATVAIPVTGCQTPPTGPVTTSIGAVAYEGDGDSIRLSAAVTLDVSGGGPIAGADTAGTTAGTPVDVAVLANDTANDTAGDGSPLTVTAAGVPAHGTTVLHGDGTVTYTPAAGFAGVDTFTYTLNGGPATGTVTVTVTAALAPGPSGGPVVVTTPMVTTPAGSGAQTISPLDNVTDPDGDPLRVLGVSQPANGTAVLNAGGTVTYTPDRGFAGADSFGYTVTDGTAAVTGTVELMVGSVDLPVTGAAAARTRSPACSCCSPAGCCAR
ncbi:Ig-like domain-containing protein [Dactylosporangium cerinum]